MILRKGLENTINISIVREWLLNSYAKMLPRDRFLNHKRCDFVSSVALKSVETGRSHWALSPFNLYKSKTQKTEKRKNANCLIVFVFLISRFHFVQINRRKREIDAISLYRKALQSVRISLLKIYDAKWIIPPIKTDIYT